MIVFEGWKKARHLPRGDFFFAKHAKVDLSSFLNASFEKLYTSRATCLCHPTDDKQTWVASELFAPWPLVFDPPNWIPPVLRLLSNAGDMGGVWGWYSNFFRITCTENRIVIFAYRISNWEKIQLVFEYFSNSSPTLNDTKSECGPQPRFKT